MTRSQQRVTRAGPLQGLRSERGMALLISCYLLAVSLAMLAATLCSQRLVTTRASQLSRSQSAAFHLAEAGIDDAMKQLGANPTFRGST